MPDRPVSDKPEGNEASSTMAVRPTPFLRPRPEPEPSDLELLSAIRRGDGRAAQLLYDRLQPAIEHTIRRVLRQRSEQNDDLVQICFERVLRAIVEDRFAGLSTLTTWASAIAGHVAVDALRRSMRERRLFSSTTAAEVSPAALGERAVTERRLEARSEIQRLHRILAKMKPSLAETLVLHDVLGHNLDEVAALMGVTPSATQSRLFRARKELVRRAGAARGGNPA
ncbi:MAG TPA: RNA polymerase sigma factor [Polyangiaceae bacterium]